MSRQLDEVADEVGESVRASVRGHLERLAAEGWSPRARDLPALAERLTASLVDVAVSELELETAGNSALARRIGPVHTVEGLARWLAPRGTSLTGEAVRKRAKQRQLVAFRTDDRQWAFPAWQFDHAAGRLIPRDDVVALWQQLPADGFLTDVDLTAWMATRLQSLEGQSPALFAYHHGADAAPLLQAVGRLTARAA